MTFSKSVTRISPIEVPSLVSTFHLPPSSLFGQADSGLRVISSIYPLQNLPPLALQNFLLPLFFFCWNRNTMVTFFLFFYPILPYLSEPFPSFCPIRFLKAFLVKRTSLFSPSVLFRKYSDWFGNPLNILSPLPLVSVHLFLMELTLIPLFF